MSHENIASAANPANAASARFFGSIGIAPSMRVLDIGCGTGDLSRIVATLAGSDGEVVAIDRSEAALQTARATDPGPHAAPIHYYRTDLSGELPDLGRFDVIVGRRVLMYLPDAAATLAGLIRLAGPGAIVAFQEHARAGLPVGLKKIPLHRRLYDWMWSTVAAEGGDVGLALRLVDMMRAAGLTIADAHSEGVLLHSHEPSFLPTLARSMLPRLIERGVASAEDVDIDTLADRIDAERHAVGGTILWDLAFCISAHVG